MKIMNKIALQTKLLLLLLLVVSVSSSVATEYRFRHAETTGLCDFVCDSQGRETTIVIASNSDSECLALLKALQQKRVYGTKGMEDHMGIKWEQAVFLTGEFASKPKRTESGPNTASPEEYRDFKITGLEVRFPLSRFIEIPEGNVIDGPIIMETHFGFDSLFPQGVKFVGKPIDLSKHVKPRPDPN